jgi:hypothetical protein
MNCEYVSCRNPALWQPVIEIPTLHISGDTGQWVNTDKPTYLLMPTVCHIHKQAYSIQYWIPAKDWAKYQNGAKARGFKLEDLAVIQVKFRELGWYPHRAYEIERSAI